MEKNIIILTVFFMILMIESAYGQGCSDAGVCTTDNFSPHISKSESDLKNQLSIGMSYGKADNSITVLANYIKYNNKISTDLSIDSKLTTISQNGNGISTFGISDFFININYFLYKSIAITLGAKIPLSNSSEMKNNLALPMDYQASLGTYDLIFGIGSEINNFHFAAAVQMPLNQNKNEFVADLYPENSEMRNFQTTNKFHRSGDLMLRVSYPVNIDSNLRFTTSLLPIYHFSNDKFTDLESKQMEIMGSKGLTFNINAFIEYKLNDKNILQLNLGFPVIVRKARPDGLTRSFLATLEYKIKF